MPEPVDLSDLMQDAPKSRNEQDFHALMDKTFGPGKWRETGGYRTQQREAQLRAQGAGTVAPGRITPHALGDPEAPGARDVVVDGLTPAQVAAKLKSTGARFRSFFPEGRHGSQGAHLHINTDLTPDPVDLSDLMRDPAKTVPFDRSDRIKGPMPRVTNDQVRQVLGLPPKPPEKAPPARFSESARDLARIAKHPLAETLRTTVEGGPLASFTPGGPMAGRIASDVMGVPVDLLARGINMLPASTHSNVLEKRGLPQPAEITPEAKLRQSQLAANLLATVVPGASEEGLVTLGGKQNALARLGRFDRAAEAAKATTPEAKVNALRGLTQPEKARVLTAPDPEHAASVARLDKHGVVIPPAKRMGGQAARLYESQRSNPYLGGAIRQLDRDAIESANRAGYNLALKEIGETYPKDRPVGYEGVDYIGDRFDKQYEQIKSGIKFKPDEALLDDLTSAQAQASELPADQSRQIDAIIKNRIGNRLNAEKELDGEAFLQARSEIKAISREAYRKGDHAFGQAVDDVLAAITENAERHSDKGVLDQLRKTDRGYAIYSRLQQAASRRPNSFGRFSAQDLAQSVKSGGRGQFAKGNALLQDFSTDYLRVLGDVVPDSGTTERMMHNVGPLSIFGAAHAGPFGAGLGSIGDSAIGAVSNRLTYNALRNAGRTLPRATPRNYLKSIDQRVLAVPAAGRLIAPPGGPQ